MLNRKHRRSYRIFGFRIETPADKNLANADYRAGKLHVLATLRAFLTLLIAFGLLFILVQFLNAYFFDHNLVHILGVRSRVLIDLGKAPLFWMVHDGFKHMGKNLLVICALGAVILRHNRLEFFTVAAVSILTSCVAIIMFDRVPVPVVGSSGLAFGILGYLLAKPVFFRSPAVFFVLIVTVFFFRETITLAFTDHDPSVSWEAHFGGFCGGAVSAYILWK